MLLKFAHFQTIEAKMAPRRGLSKWAMLRDAKRHEFQYTPRPGFLYVRSRAISSRTNDNFDTYPAEELRQSYKTFIGKPVFVNHNNDDPSRARGVIRDAVLHEHTAPDGTPDTWVEVLMEVDARRFPRLAREIIQGNIDRTSMGCNVMSSECSYCGKVATTPDTYCEHINNHKGKRLRRRAATGGVENVLVHEICRGLAFFENSLLVDEPADPTAFFLGVDDSGIRADANLYTAIMREGMTTKVAALKTYVFMSTAGGWDLHIDGCADIYKSKYQLSSSDVLDAESADEAAREFIADLEVQGWSTRDIKILSCARSGVPVEKAPLAEGICTGSGQRFENPRRMLYAPCPVCGKRLGTGRGTVPKHKLDPRRAIKAAAFKAADPGSKAAKVAAFRPVAARTKANWFEAQYRGSRGWATIGGPCKTMEAAQKRADSWSKINPGFEMRAVEIDSQFRRPVEAKVAAKFYCQTCGYHGMTTAPDGLPEKCPDCGADTGLARDDDDPKTTEAKVASTERFYDLDGLEQVVIYDEGDGEWHWIHFVPSNNDLQLEASGDGYSTEAEALAAAEAALGMKIAKTALGEEPSWGGCKAYVSEDGKRWFCTEPENHDDEHTHFGEPFPADVEVKMAKTAETHAPYHVRERDGKWVVVNDIDEVKGTHDTKEQALEQQRALYANVPGASEQAERKSSAKTADYDEVHRDHPIETLRNQTCPVCMTKNAWDGNICTSCNYVLPPRPFRAPDTEVAARVSPDEGWFDPDAKKADPFNPVQSTNSATKRQTVQGDETMGTPSIAAAARQRHVDRLARRRFAAEDGTGTITEDEVPAAEAPAETTEETLNEPDAQGVDVETPGGVVEAPAPDAVTDVTEVTGEVIAAPAPDDVQDVEAPIAGAETVDPAASDDNAWTENNGADGADGTPLNASDWNTASRRRAAAPRQTISREAAQQIADLTRDRLFACLRLARLRIAARISDENDDIKLARQIESSNLSNESIANEVNSLTKVVTAARTAPSMQPQRQARRSPSLAGGMPSMTAAASSGLGGDDDTALFEP